MRLAFTLFRYFPYGGLERDMLAMARLCQSRGHDVVIYTREWQGPKPEDIPIILLPVSAHTNHGKNNAFIRLLDAALSKDPGRLVVGFNKMPGLDLYYAADVCFAAKAYGQRGPVYRLSGRSRSYLKQEDAVFSRKSKTHAMMISSAEMDTYHRYYDTPFERMHLLPPGIRRDRVMPEGYLEIRRQLREGYGLEKEDKLLLMVGSDFKRKGLDRSIKGLAALPEPLRRRTRLWVAGQDDPQPFNRLANSLGVAENLSILGARDDVSELLWSADGFLHPAYSENTGTVLLEAMVAGLPVIATKTCGYSHYIEEQNMGVVLDDPVEVNSMARAIKTILDEERDIWRRRGQSFADEEDIFSMTERAAELIERVGKKNG